MTNKTGDTDLVKGLLALVSHLILVTFGDFIEGSALQPQVHLGGSALTPLPHNL